MAKEKARTGIRWRLWLMGTAWCAVFVTSAVAARKVHQYALTDSQFILSSDQRDSLTLQGNVYASRARLLRLFSTDYGHSIFSIPLAERRRRLLAVDWVEDASVARIWPNRLLVRITERKPVAFVSMPFHAGANSPSRYLLIDGDGVLLDPPARAKFTFPVLTGLTEDQSETDRRTRVHAMLRLLEDVGTAGQSISEINTAVPDDLTVMDQVDGHVLELKLGEGNYSKRLQNFLSHYPEIRKRASNVTTFDLRLDDRITAREP